MNRDANVPSVNESTARRAINGANRSTVDLRIDVGVLFIIDDLAGMLRINLLTSWTEGGCKTVISLPVHCMMVHR